MKKLLACAMGVVPLTLTPLEALAQRITQIIDSTGDGMNSLAAPNGVAVDGFGNVYVAGGASDNVFKIAPPHPPSPLPSTAITQIIDPGGAGTGKALKLAHGIAVDAGGNVYVTGFTSNNAFKITNPGTPSQVITEIIDGNGDGNNALGGPVFIAADADANVYVTGRDSNNAFKIEPPYGPVNATEIIDSTGEELDKTLNFPHGIAVDADGNVYVSGENSDNAFKITNPATPSQVITQIIDSTGAGVGKPLTGSLGNAVDAAGNLYMTGSFSDNVFRIAPPHPASPPPSSSITEIFDGADYDFDQPDFIAVDAAGNVYVTCHLSHNAFKITFTPAGDVDTVTQIIDDSGDGLPGHSLSNPRGIAVDAGGNVYVAGGLSDNVFKILPCGDGIVDTAFGETCDDGNTDEGDGCSSTCTVEGGSACVGEPSHCGSDCNSNAVPDDCDISCGSPGGVCDVAGCGLSDDCNGNGIPDECEIADCDGSAWCSDCNGNNQPDICDVPPIDPAQPDCNGNLIPDSCEPDCQSNGQPDECDITFCDGTPACSDCNSNGKPDICDIPPIDPAQPDCNNNMIPDSCEPDCQSNGQPDDCDITFCDGSPTCSDCNGNGIPDECDVPPINPAGSDCDGDIVPDECEADCQPNGVPDDCEVPPICPVCPDCNNNGTPDECEVTPVCPGCPDCNSNGIPDECETDCDGNGIPDECDIANCTGDPVCADCNGNGVLDSCEPCNDHCLCDDGFFCNGSETCDVPTGECQPGTFPCPDGVGCFEEADTCGPCDGDTRCDDRIYCNGLEICDEGVCRRGIVPCTSGEGCDESTQTCITCTTDDDCEDGIDCTVDTCTGSLCEFAPVGCVGACCFPAIDQCFENQTESFCTGSPGGVYLGHELTCTSDPDRGGCAGCDDGCPRDPDKCDPGFCGCYVPEPVRCPCGVAEVDSDGDGVPDCVDRCPNTPPGEPVDYCGCPLFGACCLADGSDCSEGSTQATCELMGNIYQGNGTDCSSCSNEPVRCGPDPGSFPHNRRKNRYITFDPDKASHDGLNVAFKVKIKEITLGSCDGLTGNPPEVDFCREDRKECADSGNPCATDGDCGGGETCVSTDCKACSSVGNTCINLPIDCAPSPPQTCEPTGETCVNDAPNVGGTNAGRVWWVGPESPLGNGVHLMVSEPFRKVSTDWPNPTHVGDCEIVPEARYGVRAVAATADPLDVEPASDELLVETTRFAPISSSWWADCVGPLRSHCDGDIRQPECTAVADCPPGSTTCQRAWTRPDGSVNVDDLSAALAAVAPGPMSVLPDMTWIDLHGNASGAPGSQAFDPPNFVANVSDIGQIIFGFQGLPYKGHDPADCPDVGTWP